MITKSGKALVVGAGVAGLRSALDLAEMGHGVVLIDKAPGLTGLLAHLDRQFPTNHCGMCQLLPYADRDSCSEYCLRKGFYHENIEIVSGCELIALSGAPGQYTALVKQAPSLLDPDRCNACGRCAAVCPVEVKDEFNAGLTLRKAIYLPVPHNACGSYVIDLAACTLCGQCVEACPLDAIDMQRHTRRLFTILVVDDEASVRDSISEWLTSEQYTVDTAASGEEGLAKIESKEYQLVLLDIKMPGMDGVTMLKQARTLRPELDVAMLTAYATVETAVESMKYGALDYILKPYDPEKLIEKIKELYVHFEKSRSHEIEVGTVIFACGASFFDPGSRASVFGYGRIPHVLTSLEFERLLSACGPSQGRLARPQDQKMVERVAWIQCVGSRDLQSDADFCSSICCMMSLKEALWAKSQQPEVDTVIFYMDLRTFGKTHQRYADAAAREQGVRTVHGKVHSLWFDTERNDVRLRHVTLDGRAVDEHFDLVVLALGQRPRSDIQAILAQLGVEHNHWGFPQPREFSLVQTAPDGIYLSGAVGGMTDIADALVQASAAAAHAALTLRRKPAALPEALAWPETDVTEMPRVMVALQAGPERSPFDISPLQNKPPAALAAQVTGLVRIEHNRALFEEEALLEAFAKQNANRLLVATAFTQQVATRRAELAQRFQVAPHLIEIVDIRSWQQLVLAQPPGAASNAAGQLDVLVRLLRTGLTHLKWRRPEPPRRLLSHAAALVVGGGVAGMTTALMLAEHGHTVHLVEQEAELGGNLRWIRHTLDHQDVGALLLRLVQQVKAQARIHVHCQTEVMASTGSVGDFRSTLHTADQQVQSIAHAVTILATGGREAPTAQYAHGRSPAIMTQQQFQMAMDQTAAAGPAPDQQSPDIQNPDIKNPDIKNLDLQNLDTVVMIQCVESRETPKPYCSRICCATSLKQALALKAQRPEITIYVLYRDIMTYGFMETWYTQARAAGILFIRYDPAHKPAVDLDAAGNPLVRCLEPVLHQTLEIAADLVILATGIKPQWPARVCRAYDLIPDQDGFFAEADSKWRSLEAPKPGILACGLVHSPRNITESMVMAEACAARALGIMNQSKRAGAHVTARVRDSLCSRCERCIATCSFHARYHDGATDRVIVVAAACRGCGACTAACPNGAAVLDGFAEQQMFELLDVVTERGWLAPRPASQQGDSSLALANERIM